MNRAPIYRIAGITAVLLSGAGYLAITSRARTTAQAGGPPPPEVVTAAVEQRDLPIQREWVGTLNGLVNAAINAEVTGYLLRQDYSEGSFVH